MREEVGDIICKHVLCMMHVHAQVLVETFNFIWYKYTFGEEVYKSTNFSHLNSFSSSSSSLNFLFSPEEEDVDGWVNRDDL